MAPAPEPIRCKSCSRTLATVSPTGLVPALAPDTEGCDTCQKFNKLYDAMQTADLELAKLENKSDQNRVKQAAIDNSRKMHLDFGNWLFGVEAPLIHRDKQQDGKAVMGFENVEQFAQGIKRGRSLSPVSQQPEEGLAQTKAFQTDECQSPQQQQSLSIPHRPSPKRSRSAASLPERKRIRFSDSVEFREEYRSYLTLARSREEYVPGRYAPPEDGYLDTSGADQGWVKFTGVRKAGGKWVEVAEKDDKRGKEGTKTATELRRLDMSGHPVNPEQAASSIQDVDHNDGSQPDSRAARLARRTRRSSNVNLAPMKDAASGAIMATAQDVEQKLLNDSKSDTHGPSCETAPTDDLDETPHQPAEFTTSAAEEREEGQQEQSQLQGLATIPVVEHSFEEAEGLGNGEIEIQGAVFKPFGNLDSNTTTTQAHPDIEVTSIGDIVVEIGDANGRADSRQRA